MIAIMILRSLLGRCPHCGTGHMYTGLFALQTRCEHCGIRYENQVGDFTGAVHISATVISGFGMVLGVATMVAFDLTVWETVILDVPIILLVGLLIHRIIKSIWIALLVNTHALSEVQDYWEHLS